jgi:hypothetical protein
MTTSQLRYRSKSNPDLVVLVLDMSATLRLGQTKWTGMIVYQDPDGSTHVRTQAEFSLKFAFVNENL